MKIVFYGNFIVNFTSETHWARSLESLGHKVVKLQESVVPTDVVLSEALEADALVWVHTHTVHNIGSLDMREVLATLKDRDIPTIAYHLDLYMGINRWRDYEKDVYLNDIEYFFTVDKLMADYLNEHTSVKAHYLPAGVYDAECVMMSPQQVNYDIVFTGSKKYHPEYPYRPQLIDFLTHTYGRKFVHIGNDGEVPVKRGLLLNQIYRNAKIAIGDTLNIDFNYPYYFSDRLFEQPGRGAFQIFPYIEGVDDMYKPDEEIVLYKHGDLSDLKDKIDYYLANSLQRDKIRQSGFERTKSEHTYVDRWREILTIIESDRK